MGEVIELKEPFSYMFVDAKIAGVKWEKGSDYLEFWASGTVWGSGFAEPLDIEPQKLKTLMIMWLSLEYPEVINFDVK